MESEFEGDKLYPYNGVSLRTMPQTNGNKFRMTAIVLSYMH
jgi:hypothetical protein